MLAIRQVTQLNNGKYTSGFDTKSAFTDSERRAKQLFTEGEKFQLEKELALKSKTWKPQGLREVSLSKPDGTKRIQKPLTLVDCTWQCLIQFVLEPAHAPHFHDQSYGFRSGRSCQDAQQYLFNTLRSTANGQMQRIIVLDMENCFARISHNTILNSVICPKCIKSSLQRCLKVGVSLDFPKQGKHEGGVVSPLLSNIVLNGIESIHQSVRYADEMRIFLKPQDDEQEVLNKINNFLEKRGMNVNQAKTYVVSATSGFDFLGWSFQVLKSGKFITQPTKTNYENLKKKIKAVVNNSAYGAKVKSNLLSRIVRGWRNYHKHCDMRKHNLWNQNHRAWKVFNKERNLNKNQVTALIKKAFPRVSYSINKFVMVKGNKSAFDGDLMYCNATTNARLNMQSPDHPKTFL
jgi:group II intron reverse transcriptase/maturase